MSDRIGPIGPYNSNDLRGLLRLSLAQDWPHTEEDWRTILASGEVFGHRLNANEFVSCAAMIPYGGDDGAQLTSLGMIIVDAKARRQGLGQALMQEAVRRASTRTPPVSLRLISTRDGRPLYEKNGFLPIEDLYSYRRPPGGAAVAKPSLECGQELRSLDTTLTNAVIALDAAAFGHTRNRMLEQRIAQAERGLVLFNNGVPVGYGLLVRQNSLANLGPVIAPDDAAALALITGLMSTQEEDAFRIDLPARQQAIFTALESLGFAENDVPPIMLRCPDETQKPNGLEEAQRHYYGIASQAFG